MGRQASPLSSYCLADRVGTVFSDWPSGVFPVMQSDVRLLKLYESGLPGWAVWLPSYGLWYRPWFRRVTWVAFVLVSIFSMACGFYDLYKNVPFLREFVVHCFLPASAVFEWLEAHTQVGQGKAGVGAEVMFALVLSKAKSEHQIGQLPRPAYDLPLLRYSISTRHRFPALGLFGPTSRGQQTIWGKTSPLLTSSALSTRGQAGCI